MITFSLIMSCSNNDSNENTTSCIPFSDREIVGSWEIIKSTSTKSDFSVGKKALFFENGICLGFHTQEERYELREGKMFTFENGDESIAVYSLQSIKESSNDTILNVKVNSNLDNSPVDITVKKYEEFPNWKNRNDKEFLSWYQKGKSLAEAGESWKIINNYSGMANSPTDCIVMQILDAGKDDSKPSYSDMVSINYRGRLIPSASYPQGLVIDQTFTGSYNPSTGVPCKGKVSNFIIGLGTALLHMNRGGHYIVYIPYQLAFGSSGTNMIPAYSMLIYEVWLLDF